MERQPEMNLHIPRGTADPRQLAFAFGSRPNPSPNPQPKPKPKKAKPALCVRIGWHAQKAVSGCLNMAQRGRFAAADWGVEWGEAQPLSGCLALRGANPMRLTHSQSVQYGKAWRLANCQSASSLRVQRLRVCQSGHSNIAVWLHGCGSARQSRTGSLKSCTQTFTTRAEFLGRCNRADYTGKAVSGCLKLDIGTAIPVPCEWYTVEIPEPPPELPRRCHPIDSRRLPFALDRPRDARSVSRMLPFPFACRRARAVIPNLDSYIMLNKIQAYAGSLKLNPIAIHLSHDRQGYYWTCEVELSPDDFAALNLVQYDQGKEPLVTLKINANTFTFIAESYRDNRTFARRSYTVSGRSQTARLGADYAQLQQGMVTQAMYARQIADGVLENTGFRIGTWGIPDWLVPARVYSLADKTPIAVLADIAQAAGGFVQSDPAERIIHIKPRFKVAAWQLAHSTPDVSIPASVITQISGQKQISTQCYGVFVSATHNKGVFRKIVRKASAGSPEASTLSHALYTADEPCLAAGIAALGDTGANKTEQIELPIMEKYALGIAQLGEIWQVTETSGAWLGIVDSVSITVSLENDAPKIMQSVGVWRYLGE